MQNDFDQKIRALDTILKDSKSTVALTGAGISVPSGIPDFRSATGLYATPFGKFNAESVISHEFFVRHTDVFFDFYKSKMIFPSAQPNFAHKFLSKLEQNGRLDCLITQNIDCLHTDAGSKNVCELHGNVRTNYCQNCGKAFDLDYVLSRKGVPHCDKCGGVVKPDVVLYGESLDGYVLTKAVRAVERADVFLIVGTSLSVYPAAGLLSYFEGSKVVLINLGATPYDSQADLVINCDCEQAMRALDKLW